VAPGLVTRESTVPLATGAVLAWLKAVVIPPAGSVVAVPLACQTMVAVPPPAVLVVALTVPEVLVSSMFVSGAVSMIVH
jgi:hypothetical protein